MGGSVVAMTQQLAEAEDRRWRGLTQDEGWTVRLSKEEVRSGLAALQPQIPLVSLLPAR